MTNKEIATTINELADLMELHEENQFKVRSYKNAYVAIRRFPGAIEEMETEEILGQRGLGKSIVNDIEELLDYGRIAKLDELRERTPEGVRDMLLVKGLGPKKIKVIWKEMGIESIVDLLYACNENRLVEARGFGEKTQQDLLERLDFFLSSRGKLLYSHAENLAAELIALLNTLDVEAVVCGQLLLKDEVVASLELVCTGDLNRIAHSSRIEILQKDDHKLLVLLDEESEFTLHLIEGDLQKEQLSRSFPDGVHSAFLKSLPVVDLPPPELWNNEALDLENMDRDQLIVLSDIKGVIHNHTTFSDGSHTLREMAEACKHRGYEYFVVSDHSRSAFYANGLEEERVEQQWREIDQLNLEMSDFRIFKSIESDILYDGSLDYSDPFLSGFDLVIASIHSQLKMDMKKAMSRLISAVEHPATRILGHPTGRLLLGRAGYPVDHKKLIDACAANGVVLELNANPYRLDIDWRWVSYAQEKGVMVSINPDAHHIDGIDDIRYGVLAARKGGLYRDNCLSAMDVDRFAAWL